MTAIIAIILSILTAIFVAMNTDKSKWHETIEERLTEVELEISKFNERYEAIKEEK